MKLGLAHHLAFAKPEPLDWASNTTSSGLGCEKFAGEKSVDCVEGMGKISCALARDAPGAEPNSVLANADGSAWEDTGPDSGSSTLAFLFSGTAETFSSDASS